MRAIVTCGPSFEPIDQVRRITNFSSGELGLLLANRLAADGAEVWCFKGVGATACIPLKGAKEIPFTTNADLLDQLKAVPTPETVGAVFHVAALCDFMPGRVLDANGSRIRSAKIPSRCDGLMIELVPAPKLIPELRSLFPASRIVGWKYEMVGSKEDAIAKGIEQIARNRTDACVVNGKAYGSGFGICDAAGLREHLESKQALCERLSRLVAAQA